MTTAASPTPLTPRVPGTYRGRCDCQFWICTKSQLNYLKCPGCGAYVRHATAETMRNHSVVDTIAEPRPEPTSKKKVKPVSNATRLLDAVDEREVQRQRNQGAA